MKKQNSSQIASWLYPEVGRRIREARTGKARFTQAQTAALVGLNRTSIAKIEAGEQRFTLDTLYLLASALDVPVTSLLPKPESKLKMVSNEQSILKSASAPEGLRKNEMESILNAITEARSK